MIPNYCDHSGWDQEWTLRAYRKTIASRFFYVCQSGWPALSTTRWEWILKGTFTTTLRDCWERVDVNFDTP
jgi:hypothetical protein